MGHTLAIWIQPTDKSPTIGLLGLKTIGLVYGTGLYRLKGIGPCCCWPQGSPWEDMTSMLDVIARGHRENGNTGRTAWDRSHVDTRELINAAQREKEDQ